MAAAHSTAPGTDAVTRWPSMFCVVGVMLCVYVALLGWSIWSYSPTRGETAHLPAGLSHWEFGDFTLYGVNPPLVRLWSSAIVSVMGPRVDWSDFQPRISAQSEFYVAHDFVEVNGSDSIDYFRIARCSAAVFPILGAGLCLGWGWTGFGKSAGITAGLLWMLSPLVLGHGSLITPDVGAASLGALACWQLRTWYYRRGVANAGLTGLAFGLALLTKFTWVIVLPVTAIVIVVVLNRIRLETFER